MNHFTIYKILKGDGLLIGIQILAGGIVAQPTSTIIGALFVKYFINTIFAILVPFKVNHLFFLKVFFKLFTS